MTKIKFCGVAHVEDAIFASNYADFIGVITDTVSPRFVKDEFVSIVKRYVDKPVVNVKVNININDLENVKGDYIQIHRVLSDDELKMLPSFNKKFILYVPSSLEYEDYLKKIISIGDYLILVDSKKKGEKVNLEIAKKWIREYSKVGIGGGITPDNVEEFLFIEPYWIDVSSGIEKYKSKKDFDKMRKIVEKVKSWKSIQ